MNSGLISQQPEVRQLIHTYIHKSTTIKEKTFDHINLPLIKSDNGNLSRVDLKIVSVQLKNSY
jgi:hypothetical protein